MATSKQSSAPPVTSGKDAPMTVPGLTLSDGHTVGEKLQMRLHALNDLALVLKHIHWNVVGRDFIGVHEMLDPHIEGIRVMVDDIAERMAMLGVAPNGLSGDLVKSRSWNDYSLMRAETSAHLAALDLVYTGVIADHRQVMDELEKFDLVTQDMLVSQVGELEKYQWFVRAHLQNSAGTPINHGAKTEKAAAKGAVTK